MHTITRGRPATPMANGDCPRTRHSRKYSQSNSFSRSTGVDDSTTGVTRQTGPSAKSMQAIALSTWSTRGWPVFASTCFQSYKRNVTSLFCWISNTTTSLSKEWTVPAFRNTASPGWGVNHASSSGTVPSERARRKLSAEVPRFRPAYTRLPAPASSTTHASVFGVSPAGSRFVFAFVVCTWTESISRASRNFSNNGNRRKRPASCPNISSGNCFIN